MGSGARVTGNGVRAVGIGEVGVKGWEMRV